MASNYLAAQAAETWRDRIYRWSLEKGELSAVSRLEAGEKQSKLLLSGGMFQPGGRYTVCCGEGMVPGRRVELEYNGALALEGLPARGNTCCFQVYAGEEALTPLLCFRTIFRYPYGRRIEDMRGRLIQQPGEGNVARFDTKYYTGESDISGIRNRLTGTNVEGYLEHIVRSVTADGMTQMQKAIAIGSFLGGALQHNPLRMNLKETLAAMDEFEQKGWKDFSMDDVTVCTLELGYTRCMAINGFVSCSLLRIAGIENKTYYGCGGHTSGQAYIDGAWRLWDVDGFKEGLPLHEGGLPAMDWLLSGHNALLLDTLPSWNDANPFDGWMTTHAGTRMTGIVGGGKYHSETGYTSSWENGGENRAYPPSFPLLLPVRRREGARVTLEWIGSYARNNNLKDYEVELLCEETGEKTLYHTTGTALTVALPAPEKLYRWTARARDTHGDGTEYEGKIHYTALPHEAVPEQDVCIPVQPWDALPEEERRAGECVVGLREENDFQREEGFDDLSAETTRARTELFPLPAGAEGRRIYRLVDVTNCWGNRCFVRSLFAHRLQRTYTQAERYQVSFMLYLRKCDIAGSRLFPLLWAGRYRDHTGFGLMVDAASGRLATAANVYGDWRMSRALEPCGWLRLDLVNLPGRRKMEYYVNGELYDTIDESEYRENSFDIDCVYLSSNPEAEIDYMVSDIVVRS